MTHIFKLFRGLFCPLVVFLSSFMCSAWPHQLRFCQRCSLSPYLRLPPVLRMTLGVTTAQQPTRWAPSTRSSSSSKQVCSQIDKCRIELNVWRGFFFILNISFKKMYNIKKNPKLQYMPIYCHFASRKNKICVHFGCTSEMYLEI